MPFKLIKDIPYGLPKKINTKFVLELNSAIKAFNRSKTVGEKKAFLDKIKKAFNQAEYHSPPDDYLAKASAFYTLKNNFLTKIKKEYQKIGIETLSLEQRENPSIADVLENISQKKSDRLMQALMNRNTRYLKTLYANEDTEEAKIWQNFLKCNSIGFLGGANSKNFKVENTKTKEVKVLKVDIRLGMPRNVEMELRDKLGAVLTPNYAEKQARGQTKGRRVSHTLIVTDYCDLGSVKDHSAQAIKEGEAAVRQKATDILGQMAKVFLDIEAAGCFFPDAKYTNWLVDSEGHIRIADTKSFVKISKEGNYSKDVPGNEYLGLLYTPGFIPSEYESYLNKKEPIAAGPAHAALLGRNIYAYLTGRWPYNLSESHAIFEGMIGKKYEALILKLTKDPPSSRMSVADALTKLRELELLQNKEYQNALQRLTLKKDVYSEEAIDKIITDVEQHFKKGNLPSNEVANFLSQKEKEFIQNCATRSNKAEGNLRAFNTQFGEARIDRLITDIKSDFDGGKINFIEGIERIEAHTAMLHKVSLAIENLKRLKENFDEQNIESLITKAKQAFEDGDITTGELAKVLSADLSSYLTVQNIISDYRSKEDSFTSGTWNTKADKLEQVLDNIAIVDWPEIFTKDSAEITALIHLLCEDPEARQAVFSNFEHLTRNIGRSEPYIEKILSDKQIIQHIKSFDQLNQIMEKLSSWPQKKTLFKKIELPQLKDPTLNNVLKLIGHLSENQTHALLAAIPFQSLPNEKGAISELYESLSDAKKRIIEDALKENPNAIELFQDDKALVVKAITQNGLLLEKAGSQNQQDPEIIQLAYKQTPTSAQFAHVETLKQLFLTDSSLQEPAMRYNDMPIAIKQDEGVLTTLIRQGQLTSIEIENRELAKLIDNKKFTPNELMSLYPENPQVMKVIAESKDRYAQLEEPHLTSLLEKKYIAVTQVLDIRPEKNTMLINSDKWLKQVPEEKIRDWLRNELVAPKKILEIFPESQSLKHTIFSEKKLHTQLDDSQKWRLVRELRISLEKAYEQFPDHQEIKKGYIESQFNTLYSKFEQFKFGKEDSKMDEYLAELRNSLSESQNLSEAQAIVQKTEEMLGELKQCNALIDMKKITIGYRRNALSKMITLGMSAKANNIEAAMGQVPIPERAKLLESEAPEITKVLKALASHRISWTNPIVKRNQEEQIRTKDAAETFKTFKERYNAQMNKRKDVINDDTNEVSTTPKKRL